MKEINDSNKVVNVVAFVRSTCIYDDSRATKEINALLDGGYKVVVLGWDRNGEAESQTMLLFKDKNVVCHFYHCIVPSGIGIKNLSKLLKWIRWTKKELNTINRLYAVHACNLDGGFGAYLFCKKRKIPLIYDIYDYYIDSHNIPRGLRNLVEVTEKLVISFANVTIICTEQRRKQIKNANPKNVLVIHNSPDVASISNEKEKYDYAYCGSLCDMRLIKEIVEEYVNHKELKFAFAGNDKYKQYIQHISSQYENIQFFGTITYNKVLEIESQSKVLSAIYEPSIKNHKLCAPNKFYEALALGKPLIVCKGTGIDEVVKDNNIGIVINYSSEEFFMALKTLLRSEKNRREMGQRARQLYEDSYRWSMMQAKLQNEYKQLYSRK